MDILASGVSAWLCTPPWRFSWGLDCSSACEFQLAVFPALDLLLNIPAIQSNRFRVAEVPGYTEDMLPFPLEKAPLPLLLSPMWQTVWQRPSPGRKSRLQTHKTTFPLFRDPRLAVTLFLLNSKRLQDSNNHRLFCSAGKINPLPANRNAYRSAGQTSAEKSLNFTYHTAGVCTGTSTKPCANKALCASLQAKRRMETLSLTNHVALRRLWALRLLVRVTVTPVLLGVTGPGSPHPRWTSTTAVPACPDSIGKCFMTFGNSISFWFLHVD